MEPHVSTSGKYCWHKLMVFFKNGKFSGEISHSGFGCSTNSLVLSQWVSNDFLELVVIYLLCFSMLRLVNGKLKWNLQSCCQFE
jgi:hypothetical protein